MPNCTVIKTSATVTSTASERVAELKELISSISVPIIGNVGDVVLYDSVGKSKIVVKVANLSTDKYPISRYTPIGVVAIPTSHNVYGTGECGVVSLKYMNYSTPDEGSTSIQSIYWGYNSLLLGTAYNSCVQTGTEASPTAEASAATAYPYMPSDIFSGTQCPTDPEAYYYNSSTGAAAPSPYLEDGSRNPVYYQTTDPCTTANCLSDFDGVGGTQLMLDKVTVSDWKTSSTISNSYSSGNYPSACCCWRYHTAGTSQGDWYLPACGELGYVVARLKTINNTITNLISVYGGDIGSTIGTNAYLWSCSEYSASGARYIGTYYGYVYSDNKYDYLDVRALLRC